MRLLDIWEKAYASPPSSRKLLIKAYQLDFGRDSFVMVLPTDGSLKIKMEDRTGVFRNCALAGRLVDGDMVFKFKETPSSETVTHKVDIYAKMFCPLFDGDVMFERISANSFSVIVAGL